MGTIEARLNLVELFLHSENAFFTLFEVLKKFKALDPMVSCLVQVPKVHTIRTARSSIKNFIILKDTLEVLPELHRALCSVRDGSEERSSLLEQMIGALATDGLKQIQKQLLEFITTSTTVAKSAQEMRHQECFAVKTGHDGLLDVARKTYSDILADIAQLETTCQQQLADYCALKLHFTERRGYHFVLPPSAAQQMEQRSLPIDL